MQQESLESIVWKIRRVALHETDDMTLDTTIVALADYLNRRQHELCDDDRQTLLRAAALLWRVGFNLSKARQPESL